MQMSKDDSLKKQSQENEQKLSRTLQSNEVNRLRFSEDGSPHCELVGLLPFGSVLNRLSHESALAIELAVRHLNEGNGALVSELDGLPNSCPITFSASFFDTRRSQSHAFSVIDELTSPINPAKLPSNSTTLVANPQFPSPQDVVSETTTLRSAALPCAFVGAIDSRVSKTVALVTGLRGFPQISSGSTSTSLSNNNDFPLFGRTIPDDAFAAEAFVRLLHDTMGVRNIFVIFESHPYTRSILSSIRDAIVKLQWEAESGMDESEEKEVMYVEDRIIESQTFDDDMVSEKLLHDSISALKKSEYRFVLALTTSRITADALMQIAYDKEVAGTPDGSYHWWFFESLEAALIDRKFPKNSTLAKAYNGAGSVAQTIDKTRSKYDKFLELSTELKRELYKNTQQANDDEEKGLFAPEATFLNASEWFQEGKGFAHSSAGFSYDATVLVGLSACEAISGGPPSGDQIPQSSLFLEGNDYFEVIKQTNFTGITGDILLDPETGTRDGHSVQYTITNWVMKHNDDTDLNETGTVMLQPTVAYVYAPGGDENWEEVNTFIFSGGKTVETLGENPDLPPPIVEYNTVNWTIQAVAGAACALILFMTIGCAVWVHQHKNSRVIRASQPFFLLLICLGVGIMALAIVPASLEHSTYSNSATCNSYVSLFTIGFGITFSTFLAKTYRINKIMDSAKQFKRIKLSVRDTLYPVAIVLSFNIILITLMIIFGPVVHEEITVDTDDFGRPTDILPSCDTSEAKPYMYVMLGMHFVLVCLALFQAWKARNLATEFAESRYIGNVLMISIIVLILLIPVVYLLNENPNADTFIHTIAIAIVCGAIIGFIFVPKMWKYYKHQEGSIISKYNGSNRTQSTVSRGPETRGERILTTKTPQELASDMKKLERELSRMKKEGNELQIQNTALRKRVQELTGVDESNGIVSDVSSKETSELSNTMKEEQDIDPSDSTFS